MTESPIGVQEAETIVSALCARYRSAADFGSAAETAALFTPDAWFGTASEPTTGAEAIGARVTGRRDPTQHHHVIGVEVVHTEAGLIESRTRFALVREDGTRRTGTYRDEISLAVGAPRFRRREVEFD